jgi:hypothetical protein
MKTADRKRINRALEHTMAAITQINRFKKERRTAEENFFLEEGVKYHLQSVNRRLLMLLNREENKDE